MLNGEATIRGATLEWAALSDVGLSRALNEDAAVAAPPVFVVADGMGGHDAGEVASALTVDRFRNLGGDAPTTVNEVSLELHHVNELLRSAAGTSPGSMMGTTGVGLALVDNGGAVGWLVFNVGDSRAYSYADGVLTQVSRDHSYVQELVDSGQLQHEDARVHPQRNVVTQALGAGDDFRPDYWVRPLRTRERFLLCTDGLSGEVDDDRMSEVMAAGLDPERTVRQLVDLALAAGGHDNITALVVDVVTVDAFDDYTTETRPGRGASAQAGVAVLDPPTVTAGLDDRIDLRPDGVPDPAGAEGSAALIADVPVSPTPAVIEVAEPEVVDDDLIEHVPTAESVDVGSDDPERSSDG
jgi:protein phosphatase